MKKLFDTVLPKFARVPLLVLVLFNFFTYFLIPVILGEDVQRYDLSISWDYLLPFVPFFLLFYILAFGQWVGSYIGHCRQGAELCCKIVMADLIAKFICLVCFILIPTEIVRPEVEGSGLWEWGTRFIYAMDKPINLFPSIHCLESWICFRTAMMLPKKNPWYITAQGIFTLFVFASTVLLKQHFIVDIPAGILAVEIGLLLSKRCGLWKLISKLQPKNQRPIIMEHTKHE